MVSLVGVTGFEPATYTSRTYFSGEHPPRQLAQVWA
jgi:hypothetical protein